MAQEVPKDSVGSSWNSAGTWEEKDMSIPARAELEKAKQSSTSTSLLRVEFRDKMKNTI